MEYTDSLVIGISPESYDLDRIIYSSANLRRINYYRPVTKSYTYFLNISAKPNVSICGVVIIF